MITHILLTETILYVHDQERSRLFYEQLFRTTADLHVPGMTEFQISAQSKIGLMPNAGIARILENTLPHPESGNGIPRCELYFYVSSCEEEFHHAMKCGALLVSEPADRDWGDRVGYVADPDGHVIAFAQKNNLR